ncbi:MULTISPECIES: MFS transporter [unclassified Enterococcus]|uniref:MFS transporter n=1 Tax=unclassified Enterococcus TaxID=2608891 RepID=UPI001CE1F0D4|nr:MULTISPECIES: MFS transporter [unclassified Enterococcus]MCA5012378.1 MFS transporter [Enterococcus sp. S23]MCA5015629.1 MFS transporter [Enterococcus sp. S22(2020)]
MDKKEPRNVVWMLTAIFLGYSCIYVDKMTIGMSLVTIATDLGFDPQQKGLILSAFFLGYTIFQIPFGYLSNKIGTRKMMITSVFLVGIFLCLFGFGFSLLYLIMVRFMTGAVAHSGYPSSVSTFISQELPLEKRGPAQSTMIASSGFASIIGPLLIAPLLVMVGWHKTYYLLGVAVMLIAVMMYFVIPKEFGGVKEQLQNRQSISFKEVLKDRNVWVMIFAAFFINAAVYGLNGWMATYLVEAHGLALTQTAYVSAVIGLFTMVAAMAGGVMVNKYFMGKEKYVILVATISGGVFSIFVSLVSSFIASMLFLALAVAAASLAFATLMSIPLKIFPSEEVSAKYATINAVGVSGGFVAPTIIGALIQLSQGNFFSSFIFIAVSFVVSGIITLMVQRKV